MAIKSLAQTLKDLTTGIKNTVTDITGSNATLTITKGNGTTSTVTVNNVANATNATKATQDSAGQQINTTYIKGLSISNNALIYTKGNGTTGNVDLIPAGIMQMFAGDTIPAGWLLCDGSAVSRTDYAKLFSAIGTIYGEGDGSTTFALPNLIDRVVQGAATAGTYRKAGLPNIQGRIIGWGRTDYVQAGALIYEYPGSLMGMPSYNSSATLQMIDIGIRFDASKSNLIYGSSTTVQPPALTMLPIIKY